MKKYIILLILVFLSYVGDMSTYKVDLDQASNLLLINRTLVLLNSIFFIYLATETIDQYLQIAPMIYTRDLSKKAVDKIILKTIIREISKLWFLKLLVENMLGMQEIIVSVNFLFTIMIMAIAILLMSKYLSLSVVMVSFVVFLVIDSNNNFNLWIGNLDIRVVALKVIILVILIIIMKGVEHDRIDKL